MSNSSYKQQLESTKSQIKYLENLTPEERRAAIIKMRKDQARSEIFVFILATIMGLSLFYVAIYAWVVEYSMSLMSSLGVAGGIVLNIVIFRYIQFNSKESVHKILSDDFTDEDILTYFHERERSDQQFLEQWKKKRYLLFLVMVILMALSFVNPVRDFVVILFNSAISLFLIGFVIFGVFRVKKYRNLRNKHGS